MRMTTMHDIFNEHRMLSFLTDRFMIFSHDGKKYACFSNIILPLNIAQSVVLWTWTGYQAYSHALKDEKILEQIIKLNPDNKEIKKTNAKIPVHLVTKLAEVMRTWTPDRFEDLLQEAY